MKIKLHATGNVRDCAQDIGAALVEAGLGVELTPKEANEHYIKSNPVPVHSLTWSTQPGEHFGEGVYPPVLIWRCERCAALTYAYPFEKPAELSVFHYGKQICDEDVATRYLNLYQEWVNLKNKWTRGPYQAVLEDAAKAYKRECEEWKYKSELERLKAGTAVAI